MLGVHFGFQVTFERSVPEVCVSYPTHVGYMHQPGRNWVVLGSHAPGQAWGGVPHSRSDLLVACFLVVWKRVWLISPH